MSQANDTNVQTKVSRKPQKACRRQTIKEMIEVLGIVLLGLTVFMQKTVLNKYKVTIYKCFRPFACVRKTSRKMRQRQIY